jgi:putative GTP pyrophosphokinase
MEISKENQNYKDTIFKKGIVAQEEAQQLVELLSRSGARQLHTHFLEVKELMSCFRCAILEVETKFRVLNEQLSLQYERNPIDSISSRLKSPESIYEKIERKNLPPDIKSIEEHLSDVAGVRVVCSFVNDVYMLAECLLKQDDVKLIRRSDYIKYPKPSGYRSLHIVVEIPVFLTEKTEYVPVEIQLRTIAMDTWASLEHELKYKRKETLTKEIKDEYFDYYVASIAALKGNDLPVSEFMKGNLLTGTMKNNLSLKEKRNG